MGSFSYLTEDDYPVFDEKNWYIEEIVNLIFQPEDFIVENRLFNTKNKLFWGDSFVNELGAYEFFGFSQTVKICKQRLEIFGASYKKAKEDYNKGKKIFIEENYFDYYLNRVTYKKYLNEIKYITSNKEIKGDQFTDLKNSLIEYSLGFNGVSLISHLYSILSVLPEHSKVEYDLTDVISGGYINEDVVNQINFEKIIILTEGKSDVEFISKSIEKIYPHLINYYHFIDFDEYKIESNASALVKIITSFAAAKVKHPIIALFDNDTAGLKEMNRLKSILLPDNIKILKYPDISIAKKYPTIGPTGSKKMNINGYACSIEMYFGVDILMKNEELIPIQWKGFDEKEKKYQGEISEKIYVQNRFREKLNQNFMKETKELLELLDEIFNAFR